MKWLSFTAAVVLIGSIGCSGQKTEVKGGDGKELELVAPGNTNVTQGETKTITVKVKRKNFEDPVSLEFTQLPEGVTIEEKETKMEKGATEKTFTLKADAKAPPQEGHEAKVSASGGDMKAGPSKFKIDVKEKK